MQYSILYYYVATGETDDNHGLAVNHPDPELRKRPRVKPNYYGQ